MIPGGLPNVSASSGAQGGNAGNNSFNVVGGGQSTRDLIELTSYFYGPSNTGGITDGLLGVDRFNGITQAGRGASWLPWILVGGLALVLLWKHK